MTHKQRRRFWAHVNKTSTCWLWRGATVGIGYGVLTSDKQRWRAHRLSWVMHNGPIPEGLSVLHRCDVPACVRPSHLWLGTTTDNNRDMAAKGRQVFQQRPERHARGLRSGAWAMTGVEHPHFGHPERFATKLDREKADAIRARVAAGETHTAVAAAYGVVPSMVSLIVSGQRWTDRPPSERPKR